MNFNQVKTTLINLYQQAKRYPVWNRTDFNFQVSREEKAVITGRTGYRNDGIFVFHCQQLYRGELVDSLNIEVESQEHLLTLVEQTASGEIFELY